MSIFCGLLVQLLEEPVIEHFDACGRNSAKCAAQYVVLGALLGLDFDAGFALGWSRDCFASPCIASTVHTSLSGDTSGSSARHGLHYISAAV